MQSHTVHTPAIDFSLSDQDGVTHTLSQYKGSYVLLYFYPKDQTPGCTIQACELRDSLNDLKKYSVQVLGVSTDSVASHKKFASNHHLQFPLLADVNKTVVTAYDVWRKKSLFGRLFMGIKRESFLIDPEGMIVRHYTNVSPKEHVSAILTDLKMLQNSSS